MNTAMALRWLEGLNSYLEGRVEFTHACAKLIVRRSDQPGTAT